MLSFGLAAVLRPLGDSVLGVFSQRPVLDVLTFSTTNAQNTLNIGGNSPTRAILFPQKNDKAAKNRATNQIVVYHPIHIDLTTAWPDNCSAIQLFYRSLKIEADTNTLQFMPCRPSDIFFKRRQRLTFPSLNKARCSSHTNSTSCAASWVTPLTRPTK